MLEKFVCKFLCSEYKVDKVKCLKLITDLRDSFLLFNNFESCFSTAEKDFLRYLLILIMGQKSQNNLLADLGLGLDLLKSVQQACGIKSESLIESEQLPLQDNRLNWQIIIGELSLEIKRNPIIIDTYKIRYELFSLKRKAQLTLKLDEEEKIIFFLFFLGNSSGASLSEMFLWLKRNTSCKKIRQDDVKQFIYDLKKTNLIYGLKKSLILRKAQNKTNMDRWYLTSYGFEASTALFVQLKELKKLSNQKILKLSPSWQLACIERLSYQRKIQILKLVARGQLIASQSLRLLSKESTCSQSLRILESALVALVIKAFDQNLRMTACQCLADLDGSELARETLLTVKEQDFSKAVREKAAYYFQKISEKQARKSLFMNVKNVQENQKA